MCSTWIRVFISRKKYSPSVDEQALDRPRRAVANSAGGLDCDLPDPSTELVVDRRRGSLLDQLLVTTLDRAVALPEVDHVPVSVREDLHLDVAGILEIALDVDGRVGEVRLALATGGLECSFGLLGAADDLEALPAAAGRGLDGDRPADLLAEPDDLARPTRRAPSSPG